MNYLENYRFSSCFRANTSSLLHGKQRFATKIFILYYYSLITLFSKLVGLNKLSFQMN